MKTPLTNLKNSKGFTLIEVLVVIGIVAILFAVTLIAINPAKHFQDSRDAQRRSNVTAVLNGIYEYQAANNGSVPPSLSGVSTDPLNPSLLSSSGLDLCTDLVPVFVADLPMDPDATAPDSDGESVTDGDGVTETPCDVDTATYDTGYEIYKSPTGSRFTVLAPDAEGGTIEVTR